MTEQQKLELIISKCVKTEGKYKLSCATAFFLAKETGLAATEIGKICDSNNIKICNCQLGCF